MIKYPRMFRNYNQYMVTNIRGIYVYHVILRVIRLVYTNLYTCKIGDILFIKYYT